MSYGDYQVEVVFHPTAGSAGAGLSASTVGLSSGFGTSATPSKPVGAFSFTAPVTSATANPSAGFSLGGNLCFYSQVQIL